MRKKVTRNRRFLVWYLQKKRKTRRTQEPTEQTVALNPDESDMLNPDGSQALNPA